MQQNYQTFLEDGVPYYSLVGETNIQDHILHKIFLYPFTKYKTGLVKGNIESFNVNNLLLNAIENYRMIKEDTYVEMMEYIMVMLGDSFVGRVANFIGITSTSFVDIYNLLWYINMRDNKVIGKLRLSKDEIQWVSSLTTESLYNLVNLQGSYNGSSERSSLLFTALYGAVIPLFLVSERYDIVKNYPANIAWILADKLYNMSNDQDNILPPYYYISSKELSPVELIIVNINENNVDVLAKQYGVVFPVGVTSSTNKVKYMLKEITRYGPIINRPSNLVPPSKISPVFSVALKQLEQFTSQEIINVYWVDGDWNDYRSLVSHIKRIKKEGSKWSVGHQNRCTNDQQNMARGNISYKQIIKDDPVLSYGVHNNYFCYRVSELIASWQNSNRGPFVPYWNELLLDPATNSPMSQFFSDNSLEQLKSIISGQKIGQYDTLLNIIHKFIH